MEALSRAISVAGGVGLLADKLGCESNVVSNWRKRGKVPSERCVAIEAATGGQVTRYELRPDVFGEGPNAPAAPAEEPDPDANRIQAMETP